MNNGRGGKCGEGGGDKDEEGLALNGDQSWC